MPRKHKRKFTAEEYNIILGLARIRMPFDQMAEVLKVKLKTFNEMRKSDDKLRQLISEGQAQGSLTARRTLFQNATKNRIRTKTTTLANGIVKTETYEEPPSERLLEFWCKTQEGMSFKTELEISGKDGGPIQVANLSDEELEKQLKALEDLD